MNSKIEQANKLIDGGMSVRDAVEKLSIYCFPTGGYDGDGWPIVEIDGETYRIIDSEGAICGFDQLHLK